MHDPAVQRRTSEKNSTLLLSDSTQSHQIWGWISKEASKSAPMNPSLWKTTKRKMKNLTNPTNPRKKHQISFSSRKTRTSSWQPCRRSPANKFTGTPKKHTHTHTHFAGIRLFSRPVFPLSIIQRFTAGAKRCALSLYEVGNLKQDSWWQVKDISTIIPFAFQNSNISTTQEPPVNRLRAPTTLLVTTKSPILIPLMHLYVFTLLLLQASYLRLHIIPNVLPGDTFLRFLYVRTVFIKSAQGHSFVPRSFDDPSFSSELFPENPDRLVVLALRVREEIRDPRAVVPFVLVPRCCYPSGGRLRELDEEEKVMNHPSSIVCLGCRHGARGTANDFFWDVIITEQPGMLTF